MGQRKRKLRKPDKRGRIPADVGWKQNDRGKWVQHTFYLGSDENEAKRRLMRLDEFWDRIEYQHNITQYPDELPKPEKPTWTQFTLGIALQLAAGELQIPVERGTSDPDGYATKIHALSRKYPSINFVPSDEDAYSDGAASARDRANDRMEAARWIARSQGELPPREIATLDPHNLFDALDAYVEYVKQKYRLDGETVTPYGAGKLAMIERFKERHDNMPLASLTFDGCQSLIRLWQNRPKVKGRQKAVTRKTAQNHIAEWMCFFRWLNRTNQFDWRKPLDFDEIETQVPETADDKRRKVRPNQVETYGIDELRLLNEYATPLERVLFLLGLNCGFGGAEQGSIHLQEISLCQPHPFADVLGFQTSPDDSFIKRVRLKSGVYGEHLLWPQTAEVVRWAINRRQKQGDATPDAFLLLTDEGNPFFRRTEGNNPGRTFQNKWNGPTRRIQADYPEFPWLSFGKLRKTAGNLVRRHAGGEVARIFLCHGKPVPSDELLDLYTNRPFGEVFEALRSLQEQLQPVFDSAPKDLWKQPKQQYTGLKKVKRIKQLKDDGKSIREIAEMVGLSKTTVGRHLVAMEKEEAEAS
ncbi:Resolvase helix-turn-helix domain protein [Planctomycetales bacterium 10988]|nr:Resolvase helix-turn-helix domain protein [Planctomycetales bacterium 10988]